jgi:hypothetical protein
MQISNTHFANKLAASAATGMRSLVVGVNVRKALQVDDGANEIVDPLALGAVIAVPEVRGRRWPINCRRMRRRVHDWWWCWCRRRGSWQIVMGTHGQ